MSDLEDFALLEAWRGGDRKAGERLFDRHFAAVQRFFRNKVSDGVEDLVQQTFLACVESQERFRGDAKFRTFLLGIANNVLRNHFRRRSRKEGKLDFGTFSVHDLQPGAATMVAKQREQQLLADALRMLPVDDQVILELYYWEELKAREIAEVVGMTEANVRNRLRRSKISLEAKIVEMASSPDLSRRTVDGLDTWAAGLRKEVLGND